MAERGRRRSLRQLVGLAGAAAAWGGAGGPLARAGTPTPPAPSSATLPATLPAERPATSPATSPAISTGTSTATSSAAPPPPSGSPVRAWPLLRPLPPADEAAQVPEFFTWRARLIAALARHDAEALRDALHPQVKLSFGGDQGLAAFERLWTPARGDSAVWPTLAAVLALGGRWRRGDGDPAAPSFVAPYVFSDWPDDLDPYLHQAVIAEGVRVRSAPSADAPVIGSVGHGIVRLVDHPGQPPGWTTLARPGAGPGHVASDWLRSAVDHRVMVDRRSGRWQISLFLAGD
jgi:hypothetical protein